MLARALDRLEPHGQENPKALLRFRGLEWDGRARAVGERGLRFSLSSNGRRVDAVGWTLADIPPAARAGRVDVAGNLAIDSFTGRPALTVIDLVPAAG